MHTNKQGFNLPHQAESIETLDNKVCAMCHVMHTIYKRNMFLHELRNDTKFDALKYCHTICPKTNKLVCHIHFVHPSKFNQVLHNL